MTTITPCEECGSTVHVQPHRGEPLCAECRCARQELEAALAYHQACHLHQQRITVH